MTRSEKIKKAYSMLEEAEQLREKHLKSDLSMAWKRIDEQTAYILYIRKRIAEMEGE